MEHSGTDDHVLRANCNKTTIDLVLASAKCANASGTEVEEDVNSLTLMEQKHRRIEVTSMNFMEVECSQPKNLHAAGAGVPQTRPLQ